MGVTYPGARGGRPLRPTGKVQDSVGYTVVGGGIGGVLVGLAYGSISLGLGNWVLLKEKVLSKHGDGYRFSKDKATEFLTKYGFPNAEIERAKIQGQAMFYLRLGNRNSGYFGSLRDQVAAGVLRPPRHNIQSAQRNIRTLLCALSPEPPPLTVSPCFATCLRRSCDQLLCVVVKRVSVLM